MTAPEDGDPDPGEGTADAGRVDEEPRRGTFLVTAAGADSAVLREVSDGQVHALADNPGVREGEVLEGAVAPEPPLGVAWRLVEVEARREIAVVESGESPTARSLELAEGTAVGEATRAERAGEGEWHVLAVPEADTESAVRDLLADADTLRERAARLGVGRVEVRSAPGVVSVRYLP